MILITCQPTMKDDAKTGSPKASSVGFSARLLLRARPRSHSNRGHQLIWAPHTTPLVTVERENPVLDKYTLQFEQIHLVKFRQTHFSAFTFQTCLIWASAPLVILERERKSSLWPSSASGESSRGAQNQNCLIATTSDLEQAGLYLHHPQNECDHGHHDQWSYMIMNM